MKGKDLINIGIFSAIYFVIVFIVAMLGFIPIFLTLFFAAEKYWSTRQNFGQDYIDTITKLMPKWMCPVMFIGAFVCGIVGGLLGKALMKKHFEKAGIA